MVDFSVIGSKNGWKVELRMDGKMDERMDEKDETKFHEKN